jgi:hypothetical protein
VIIQDHPFEPSAAANPRLHRSCGKCSRIPEAHPVGRDPQAERQFLADAVELVGLVRGMSHNPGATASFVKSVWARLEAGARTYGENEYLNRDNLEEALEEGPDISGYSMLELARLAFEGASDDDLSEIRVDLVSATAHAAIADQYLRAAREKRQELGL